MRHSANELRFTASILDADGTTILADGIRCGCELLTGLRRDQPQLTKAETSHVLLFRGADATTLTNDGFVQIDADLYIVDYLNSVNVPRPGMWIEVFAHVQRGRS